MVALVLFLVRCAIAKRPLVDLRGWGRSAREADLTGALLLAVALGGVILAFATADPAVQVFSAPGPLVPPRRGGRDCRVRPPPAPRRGAAAPPRRAAPHAGLGRGRRQLLRRRGPDRRAHRHPDLRPGHRLPDGTSAQLMAALVLVRFLVALPVGAIARRLPDPHPQRPAWSTAVGMSLSAIGFALMSQWDVETPARRLLQRRAGGLRLRVRAGAGTGQRRAAGLHGSRRARRLAARWWWWPGWSGCWSASRR